MPFSDLCGQEAFTRYTDTLARKPRTCKMKWINIIKVIWNPAPLGRLLPSSDEITRWSISSLWSTVSVCWPWGNTPRRLYLSDSSLFPVTANFSAPVNQPWLSEGSSGFTSVVPVSGKHSYSSDPEDVTPCIINSKYHKTPLDLLKEVLHHLLCSHLSFFPSHMEESLSSDQPMTFPAQSSNSTTILPKLHG